MLTNARGLAKRALENNPLLMPIPDSVMNDFIRNYEPADAAHNYIFKDGTTEYIIFAGVE